MAGTVILTTGGILNDLPQKQLSNSEEHELIASSQKGDITARNKLILAHLGFIISAANHILGPYNPLLEDMIHEGILGDIIGIERFDINRTNIRYCAYGYWWVRDAITSANRAEKKYLNQHVFSVFDSDVETLDKQTAETFYRGPTTIPTPILKDRDLWEEYKAGGRLQGIDLLTELLNLTNGGLDQRQRQILIRSYHDGWNSTQIAKATGLSSRWVAVLKKRAIEEIKARVADKMSG